MMSRITIWIFYKAAVICKAVGCNNNNHWYVWSYDNRVWEVEVTRSNPPPLRIERKTKYKKRERERKKETNAWIFLERSLRSLTRDREFNNLEMLPVKGSNLWAIDNLIFDVNSQIHLQSVCVPEFFVPWHDCGLFTYSWESNKRTTSTCCLKIIVRFCFLCYWPRCSFSSSKFLNVLRINVISSTWRSQKRATFG